LLRDESRVKRRETFIDASLLLCDHPAMLPTLLTLAAVLVAADSQSHELTGKVVSVADGDTITVLDADKTQHRIRLFGIDAPERGQAFGTKSREALAAAVHEKTVRIVWKERDRYSRIVGDVYLGDRNINVDQVRSGMAWWYRTYAPKSKALEEAEGEARKERRGLWKDKDPEPPWVYRRKERERKGK
jgi:endonuclease YncB( thermonuclease family)